MNYGTLEMSVVAITGGKADWAEGATCDMTAHKCSFTVHANGPWFNSDLDQST